MSSTNETISIALISDIHLGELVEHRPGGEAAGILSALVNKLNNEIHPDIVVELGDRINNASVIADTANEMEVNSLLGALNMPRYMVLGNHDIHYIGKAKNLEIFSLKAPYRVDFFNGFKLMFIDTVDPVIGECGGHVSSEQLAWLRLELENDDLPKVIFGHHALAAQHQGGNPLFKALPGQQYVQNRKEVLEIIKQGKNVLTYINGHVHWFYFLAGQGIPFISAPSILETWTQTSQAAGHYCIVTISTHGAIQAVVRSMVPDRVLGRFEYRVDESM